MADEKQRYEPLPIPTYEEAIGSSSRTPTPLRNNEDSEPAEREGLLGPESARLPVPTRRAGYRPPPTEDGGSTRGSFENDSFLNQHTEQRSSEDEFVRQEMEELELEDAPSTQPTWGKRITALSHSFNLPFNWKLSNFKPRWPDIDANFMIALARCFAVVLVMAIVYLLFMSDLFPSPGRQMFDPEAVRQHVQKKAAASAGNIRDHLKTITQNDHVAGTEGDYALAKYVYGFFEEKGLEGVTIEQFDVYLNYPKEGGRKVDILAENGDVKWSAKIEEDKVYEDRQQTATFHGHSKSGDVTGPLIYANYGSREDYKVLYDSGIDVRGAIALVRYGGSQTDRALKIKAAELVGFVGCIIYSDPADDGFVKGPVAPDGKYMPEGAVQRGGVSLMSWVAGDVLTPGGPSIKGAPRVSKENNPGLVNIPSIPLSWGDAKHLLAAIQGTGQQVPDGWTGGIPDTEYWTGDLSSPKVRLLNEQDEVDEQPIWNVMGKITGIEQKEKSVIIGSHRDAWSYGATDAGSGLAPMLEVVAIFGELVKLGWRPLRTIEFASWDAEEYNLIGSTEYVERDIERLRKDAFVYINVDTGVAGQDFKAAGSPVFKKSLLRVLNRITDPLRNATLRELWDDRHEELEGLGAGSDYVAFQDMAGTSSLDFYFEGAHPYHSALDNFEYMEKIGDPGFIYHSLITEVWCLLILEFSDRYILPFDMSSYSSSLNKWVRELENWAENKGGNVEGNVPWSTNSLREAVLQFAQDAMTFEKWELEWDTVVLAGGNMESAVLAAHRKSHNTRMANFETHLLDLEEGGGVSFSIQKIL